MNLRKIRIDGIPVILWGEPSDKIIKLQHMDVILQKLMTAFGYWRKKQLQRVIRSLALTCHNMEKEYMKQILLCQTNAFES